jgi:hypothetical protein
VTVCSFNLLGQDKDKREKICISEQEYLVYEVIGVGNYQSATTSYPTEYVESQLPNLSSGVVADFKEKNSKTYFLRCVLKNDQLKKKKLKTYYGTSSDKSFSRIGFNKAETEALVYMGWSGIGNTCETDFYHLRKENDQWKIVKKVMMVIC